MRITAIRETFEELGVLICKSRSDDKSVLEAGHIEDFDVKTWQSKVFDYTGISLKYYLLLIKILYRFTKTRWSF